MELFALNHSEQLYFLNPLGVGRVRKVRQSLIQRSVQFERPTDVLGICLQGDRSRCNDII